MKNTLVTLGISVLMLGALFLVARPAQGPDGTASAAPGTLIAAGPFHDFGETPMAEGTVSHTYIVTNEGTEAVTVGKVYTSCMCTTAVLSLDNEDFGPFGMAGHGFIPRVNASLVPGESARLTVTFDPAAHGPAGIGVVSRVVTVEQDGAAPLVVSFTANVTP